MTARDERDHQRPYRSVGADDDATQLTGQQGLELLQGNAHAVMCLSIF